MSARAHDGYGTIEWTFRWRAKANACSLGSIVNDPNSRERDIELLREIAAGNRLAFAEFYDRHSGLMYSVACKILHDTNEAEDVLQETFLQIWEKSGQFDPRLGQPMSWAATLTRNKAIDRIRSSQRRLRLAQEAGEEQSAPALENSVNNNINGHENARLIQAAIGDLPAEQRQAIELAYFSGLTQEEISQKLSEPLGTIKARIRRGLLKLRDRLEGRL